MLLNRITARCLRRTRGLINNSTYRVLVLLRKRMEVRSSSQS